MIAAATPDGAVASTTYSGNQITMTDQAGKQKQYTYDAFGRLTSVLEDPAGLNYATTYQYDLLDDLTAVTQGSQTRTFSYDSLKRLASATNPESGKVSYIYDTAGNLKTRTDARNFTTTYTYDPLNRALTATYPSGTPNVTYTYDGSGVTNGLGHLTSISAANGTATNYTSFDAVGNIHNSTQTIAGNSYSFNYTYNLAGMLYQETYPSGRLITETHDGANRPSTLTGTLAGQQTNYVAQTGYWPHGLQYFVRGNTLRYAVGYNSRLQPTETYEAINNTNSVSTMLQYSCLNWGTSRNFGSSLYGLCPVVNNTNDNGTLQGVTYSNGGPGYSSYLSFAQSFTYDKVNRLATASDNGGWSRNFGYDQYANMWVSGSSGIALAGNTPTSNVYSTANRISGSSYDAAGNQLAVNGDTATYDAENRLTTVTEPPSMGGGTETLVYDGSGQRVQKILPSGTTNYVYDAFGRLAAEYSTNPSEAPCTTCYLSYDHLGSVRMVTDATAKVIARHDFLPFGEELPPNSAGRNGQWGPGTDNITQRFTGQIRDEETDLDYFNARYFGAALGRFTSPDPVSADADLANPQSWNRYAYVMGNPLANVDPTGMDSVTSSPITFQATGTCGIACFDAGLDGLYGGGGGGPRRALPLMGNDPSSGYPSSRLLRLPAAGGTPIAPATSPAPPPPASGPAPAEDRVPGMDIWHGQQALWSGTATVGNALAVGTAVVLAAPVAIDLTSVAIYSGSPTLFAGETPVIGKLADTSVYIGRSGYNVLNVPAETYTPAVQSTWMGQTVVSGQSFLLASPLSSSTGVFGTEAGFLQSIGYELSPGGSFLVPPIP